MTATTKTHSLPHRAEKQSSQIGFHIYSVFTTIVQIILWIPVRLLLDIFGDFKVIGAENLHNAKNPVILASNHPNQLDPAVVRVAIPLFSRHAPLFQVARSNKTYGWTGWRRWVLNDGVMVSMGAVPVPAGLKDYSRTLQKPVQVIKDNYTLCIFPGGGEERFKGRNAPVRGGIAYLAQQTGAPVIPVLITGTEGLTIKRLLAGKHTIRIRFGKPVHIEDVYLKSGSQYTLEDYKNIAEKIMERVYKLERA